MTKKIHCTHCSDIIDLDSEEYFQDTEGFYWHQECHDFIKLKSQDADIIDAN